jgi:hypothetical protein
MIEQMRQNHNFDFSQIYTPSTHTYSINKLQIFTLFVKIPDIIFCFYHRFLILGHHRVKFES